MTQEVIPISEPGVAVARGNVPGQSAILKFGENPNITTAEGFADIWDGGGTYVVPTQARIHDIASDNVADVGLLVSSGTASNSSDSTLVDDDATFITDGVAVGDMVLHDDQTGIASVISVVNETTLFILTWFAPGSGIVVPYPREGDAYRVVTISSTGAPIFWVTGLNAARLPQEEFIIMNGTTNVPTLLSYSRQFRARVFGRGVSGAIGTITSTAQTDGTITCQIIDGNNQTLMAFYTIPADKTGYLMQWWGAISNKQVANSSIQLRIGLKDGIAYVFQPRSLASAGTSQFSYKWDVPQILPMSTDIYVEADTSVNGIAIAAGFDILLIDK